MRWSRARHGRSKAVREEQGRLPAPQPWPSPKLRELWVPRLIQNYGTYCEHPHLQGLLFCFGLVFFFCERGKGEVQGRKDSLDEEQERPRRSPAPKETLVPWGSSVATAQENSFCPLCMALAAPGDPLPLPPPSGNTGLAAWALFLTKINCDIK